MKIEDMRIGDWLKRFPLTTVLVVLIWVVCMVPVPETPLSGVSMIDKWTHFIMFGGLCVVMWGERGREERLKMKDERLKIKDERLGKGLFLFNLSFLIFNFFFAWLMGGLIELAQTNLTNGVRSGEWLDFVADGIGALIGQPIGILLARFLAKWRRAA